MPPLAAIASTAPSRPGPSAIPTGSGLGPGTGPLPGLLHRPSTGPSVSLSVLLANLRLLDLDQLPDWPRISRYTFATINPLALGQKRRIQAVEWALYRLFEIWDPDEARSKLRPLFPASEQAQSFALRAAIFRCLEAAKRDGALGRDIVIRKTMLDECKGDRFLEFLAIFSSTVLRQACIRSLMHPTSHPFGAARTRAHAAGALRFIVGDRGISRDNSDINILILAHRVSLCHALHVKAAARVRYRQFSQLIAVGEHYLASSPDIYPLLSGPASSGEAPIHARRMLRDNWTGDEQWIEALLYGDAQIHPGSLFALHFDTIWIRVEADRLTGLELRPENLLCRLEERAKEQRRRVIDLGELHRQILGEDYQRLPAKTQTLTPEIAVNNTGIDLGFYVHESILPEPRSERLTGEPDAIDLQPQYENFLARFWDGISAVCPQSDQIPALLVHRSATQSSSKTSPLVALPTAFSADTRGAHDGDAAWAAASQGNLHSPHNTSLGQSARRREEDRTHANPPPRTSSHGRAPNDASPQSQTESLISQARTATRSVTTTPMPMPMSMSASTTALSLSPPKPSRLTLAERTRLSIMRASPGLPVPVPVLSSIPAAMVTPAADIRATEPISLGDRVDRPEGGHEDLAARTRRSMAGFEATQQRARLERRRSERRSRRAAPVSTSTVPAFALIDEHTSSVELSEELMVDHEAVFRSRPKLQGSPSASPTRLLFSDREDAF